VAEAYADASPRLPQQRRSRAIGNLRDLFTLQRYRITLEGWALIVFSALIGFAAWHSGTNLLYLVFATTVAIFLAQGLLVWLAIRDLRGERRLPQHVYAGRPCSINLVVQNRKRLIDSRAVKVIDLDIKAKPVGAVFLGIIPHRGQADQTYVTVFPRRGKQKLAILECISRFPVGLVERGHKERVHTDVIVYPSVFEIGDVVTNLYGGFGEEQVSQKGSGTELYGLREYVPGEHARHIHWRSSARSNKLMVIEYEKDERRHVTIQLWNVAAPGANQEAYDAFEEAVNMTATLAAHFIEEGFEVRLSTASGATADAQGPSHLYTILRSLATLQLLKHGEEKAVPETTGAIVQIQFQDNDPFMLQPAPSRSLLDVRDYEVKKQRYRIRVA